MQNKGPVSGIRVIDCATLLAGPEIATRLGDFGADVIKVEHPRGDPLRNFGTSKDGINLWWKAMARGKRGVTLSLSQPGGQAVLKRLVAKADVLIENFRPGTMEKWGLGWDELHALNPRLIMVRTTGYGQTGPYRDRPGFGTLAESMSGFTAVNGYPDSPPTLPPFALADEVAALTGTYAVMMALYHRDVRGGEGQVIDLSLYEPLFSIMGGQYTEYDQVGTVPQRTGNRIAFIAPRNLYRARDGKWVALSGSTPSIVERVFTAIGRPELKDDPRFCDGPSRLSHADELDALIGDWIGQRDRDEALRILGSTEAAVGPVMEIPDIFEDPHYRAREDLVSVPDPELGQVRMQAPVPKMLGTPGAVRRPGPRLGEHNAEVFIGELGLSEAELQALRDAGAI